MLLSFLLLACGEATDTAHCTADVSWNNWGHGFFLTWCSSCHAASTEERHGAPENITFDSEQEVARWRERIYARVILQQDMPVGGGISDDNVQILHDYLTLLEACEEP